jgi:hypothetical protein
MSIKSDLQAIELSAAAQAAGAAAGVNLSVLLAHAATTANELAILVKQIADFHPTTGADKANAATLRAILGELS